MILKMVIGHMLAHLINFVLNLKLLDVLRPIYSNKVHFKKIEVCWVVQLLIKACFDIFTIWWIWTYQKSISLVGSLGWVDDSLVVLVKFTLIFLTFTLLWLVHVGSISLSLTFWPISHVTGFGSLQNGIRANRVRIPRDCGSYIYFRNTLSELS